jgi:hypothetical protein
LLYQVIFLQSPRAIINFKRVTDSKIRKQVHENRNLYRR